MPQPVEQPVQGRAYKGFYGCDGAQAMQYRAGATIVDVYLDELMREGSGEYVSFSFDNLYFSFDRAYMQQLERQIAPLMKVGCEVYLRILIRATPSAYQLPFTVHRGSVSQEPEYLAVTITSADAQSAYGAVLNYLLSTFSSYGQGISGIILGKGIDRSLYYNYAGMLSLQEYLQTVVDAAMQTESALRAVYPDALLYLPVTDTLYPTYYTSYDLDGIYDTSMLLDGICRMMDDSGLGSFTFAPLLESDQMPFVLSEDMVKEGAAAVSAAVKAKKATDGLKSKVTVASLLASSQSYDSLLSGGALLWTPPADCTEATFALYYIYQYYANINGVTNTLFIDLSAQSIREQQELLRGIDTNTVDALTQYALPYFGLNSWDELSSADRAYKSHMKKTALFATELTEEYRSIYMGSYSYWNFATAIGSMQWEGSYGCDALTADGGSSYGRALLARMQPQGGEILYTFAKPENFSICDALTLTLAATDQTGTPIPAKVYLTMYGSGKRVEAHGTLEDGALTSLTLSGLPLGALKSCYAISLRVEPLEMQSREEQELRVYLLRVEGMSRTQGSDALQAEILAQREADQPAVEKVSLLGAYPLLLITGSTLLTLAGALMCLRASKKRKNTR
jgi:hypothetical protein